MWNRFYILTKWAVLAGVYFLFLSLFLHPVLASILSTVITVGAFFHPDNEREYIQLKRPQLYTTR